MTIEIESVDPLEIIDRLDNNANDTQCDNDVASPDSPSATGRSVHVMNRHELKKYIAKMRHKINTIREEYSILDKSDWPDEVSSELLLLKKSFMEAKTMYEEKFR